MTPEDMDKAIEATAGGDPSDIGGRQSAGYEKEHGVSQKDMADYSAEYKKNSAIY